VAPGNVVIASRVVRTFCGTVKFYRTLTGLTLLLFAALTGEAQITEVPQTVKPGRFLLEMDALSVSLEEDADRNFTGFAAATTFLSTGLTANWDVQIGAQLFLSQEFDQGGLKERDSGIGDIFVRTKWRFYEAKDTYTSAALLPYIKIPTNTGNVGNDSIEGGLIVPFETQLVGGFYFSAMAQVDFVRNDADDGYDSRWLAALALRRPVMKALDLYGELTIDKSSGGGQAEGLLGIGAVLSLSADVSLDYAMYKGISDRAADWTHVLRLNWGF